MTDESLGGEMKGNDAGSLKPVPKVAAAGVGGALAIVLVTVANALGADLPPELTVALGTVLSVGFGYFKKG